MITKILWTLIGLNTAALLFFVVYFFLETAGRHVDQQEGGWAAIIFILCVLIILLAAVPLRISKSTFSLCFSAFFAFLPLAIWMYTLASDQIPSFAKEQSMSELYYKDKTQRRIAEAIEKGDTLLLSKLIMGQDLNIQGNRVWDWDGLNYLQFAIRLRSNVDSSFDDQANIAAIRILVEAGCAVTPALPEGITRLPVEIVALLLDAGADPNTSGFVDSDPLLFSSIGQTKHDVDVAILLVRRGAHVDARTRDGATPLMYAANNAGSSAQWFEIWRLVRYLLEEAHADYRYTRPDGVSLAGIVKSIAVKAEQEHQIMPPDFMAVSAWLERHQDEGNPDKDQQELD